MPPKMPGVSPHTVSGIAAQLSRELDTCYAAVAGVTSKATHVTHITSHVTCTSHHTSHLTSDCIHIGRERRPSRGLPDTSTHRSAEDRSAEIAPDPAATRYGLSTEQTTGRQQTCQYPRLSLMSAVIAAGQKDQPNAIRRVTTDEKLSADLSKDLSTPAPGTPLHGLTCQQNRQPSSVSPPASSTLVAQTSR